MKCSGCLDDVNPKLPMSRHICDSWRSAAAAWQKWANMESPLLAYLKRLHQ